MEYAFIVFSYEPSQIFSIFFREAEKFFDTDFFELEATFPVCIPEYIVDNYPSIEHIGDCNSVIPAI